MTEPQTPRSVSAGIALLVLGLVFLVPSGLCTGIFGGGALVEMLTNPRNANDASVMLMMALIFGGPFILLGVLLIRAALRNFRAR
ncbi:MAG TPA: hypothetical protein VG889_09030 [Rhizomicrobium sp.]|nr:hypothetical protein [Rhizomicrobium sp.]